MFLFLTLISLAAAVSNGNSAICDAMSPAFGCKEFDNPNDRTTCKAEGQQMDWVTFPVKDTSRFEIFAGPENAKTTTYTPGEWITISIRAKRYNQQYRGILMYARGDDGQKIGDWEFVDRESMFHSYCENSVLHGGAELKPYLTTWRLRVPASYRGALTFEALLKVGPANTGEFYYPNDLRLTARGNLAGKDQRWYKGKVGQSCDQVCQDQDMVCDDARLNNVDTPAKVERLVTPYVNCLLPAVARCGAIGLSAGDNEMCYYRNDDDCTELGTPKEAAPTCASRLNANVGYRICPCKCNGPCATTAAPTRATQATTRRTTQRTTQRPQPTQPTQPTQPQATRAVTCTPGASGCICNGQGGCEGDGQCQQKANTNTLICVTPRPKCLYGNAGCPCEVDKQDCGSARFKCVSSEEGGVCVADTAECEDGEIGCVCTSLGVCNSNDLQCIPQPDQPRGFCTVANGATDVCIKGKINCDCDIGLACDSGLECAVVKGIDTPQCIDGSIDNVIDEVDADSAVVPAIASIVMAVAAFVQF